MLATKMKEGNYFPGYLPQLRLISRSPGFRSKINIEINAGDYTVKTAGSRKEVMAAQYLRYEVFHREYIGRLFPFGIDRDEYDEDADQLILIHKPSARVIGTYRIICSLFSSRFYSSSEFDSASFLETKGVKLEFSRACIQREFRSHSLVGLLWRGLTEYLERTGASHLFGLSSIQTTEPQEIGRYCSYLASKNALLNNREIAPHHPFRPPHLRVAHNESRVQAYQVEPCRDPGIPPLLRAYLKAGAKVAAVPALDRAYRCIDFFTVLEVEQMTDLFRKRYRK